MTATTTLEQYPDPPTASRTIEITDNGFSYDTLIREGDDALTLERRLEFLKAKQAELIAWLDPLQPRGFARLWHKTETLVDEFDPLIEQLAEQIIELRSASWGWVFDVPPSQRYRGVQIIGLFTPELRRVIDYLHLLNGPQLGPVKRLRAASWPSHGEGVALGWAGRVPKGMEAGSKIAGVPVSQTWSE